MITNNLLNEILIKPAKSFDQLKIISGYASPAMANRHINLSPEISIDLVVGMTSKEGLGRGQHIGFQKLNTELQKFNCNYSIDVQPVHIKSYIWLKNNKPELAFTGSGNYSQNAFFGGTKESFANDNAIECNALFEDIKKKSINCLSNSIDEKINFFDELSRSKSEAISLQSDFVMPESMKNQNCRILTLLSRNGDIHSRAGLNWGQRDARDPNEAYIPVPKKITDSKFFPDRARHFTMITDDGQSLDCVIAQDGGKAIETSNSNAILGRYFRKRLGLQQGAYIEKSDLFAYGRTDVCIFKIDDETYYMDFSKPKMN